MKSLTCHAGLLFTICFCALSRADSGSPRFAIHVVDEQSGRGVPLVELKTTAAVRYWTDSAGYVAIDDPVLMGRKVFFFVQSDGYDYPADGLGMRGRALDVAPARPRQSKSGDPILPSGFTVLRVREFIATA